MKHANHHYSITHFSNGKEEARCFDKECRGRLLTEKEKEELVKKFCENK